MISVFDFNDYKPYLEQRLPISGKGRGLRSRLAERLQCQNAHISQVIHGHAHFSLEHAAIIDRFLGHRGEESDYFLALVCLARAGSKELVEFFHGQLLRARKAHDRLDKNITGDAIHNEEMQRKYYSSWHYAAIHVALMKEKLHTIESLANDLGLHPSLVEQIVKMLVQWNLASESHSFFKALPARWHLNQDSSMIHQHHINWRLKALEAIQNFSDKDVHFSGPIVLGKGQAARVRQLFRDTLAKMEDIVAEPGAHEGLVVCLDVFDF